MRTSVVGDIRNITHGDFCALKRLDASFHMIGFFSLLSIEDAEAIMSARYELIQRSPTKRVLLVIVVLGCFFV